MAKKKSEIITSFPAFRQYNEAIKEWMGHIHVPRKGRYDKVKIIWASPEKALASEVRPLIGGTVDIPIISFHMTGASFNASRQYIPRWGVPNYHQIKVNGAWAKFPKALPYDLGYNVTAWVKLYQDADIIDNWFLSQFDHERRFFVNNMFSPIKLNGFSDNSDLDQGSDNDRVVRRDYNISVDGWLPLNGVLVGQIEKIIAQFSDNENAEVDIDAILNSFGQDKNVIVSDNFEPSDETGVVSARVNVYEEEET